MRDPLRNLVVGAIEVPLEAAMDLEQTYAQRERSNVFDMGDNSLIKRTYAGAVGKIETTITGRGTIPVGLQEQDYSSPIVLKCIQHRAVTSSVPAITLPPGYRTDNGSEPYGRARVNGRWVESPVISLIGDVLTLTAIAGATQYQAVYFPQVTGYVEGGGPQERRSRGNNSTWTLSFREA